MADKTMLSSDHWAHYGDGNAAQILDSREYIKTKTGKKYTKFILIPSSRIETMYDTSEEQDETGAIVKDYPSTEVVWNERGVFRSRCWIYTDFLGGPTPASRRFEELTTALNDTERLLRSAEAAKNRAYQELNTERQQKIQAIQIQSKILKEIARARGRVDGEGDDINTDLPE